MKALLITVAVLLLLLVGADIGGRAIAESKAGEALARQANLTTAPKVDIHGFSFLAQALPGHYSDITIVIAAPLRLGPLTGVTATADLHTVDFPLADAISGDTSHLTAGHADLHAVVPVASLATALRQTNVVIAAGPNGTLRLTTAVTVSRTTVPVTADLVASFATNTLRLTASHVSAAGLSGAAADSLAQSLSLAIPLTDLPVPVSSATVLTQGSDLLIDASADNVTAAQFH